jgi:hypothetical protein
LIPRLSPFEHLRLPDFSSEYAIASVKLAGGQTLYFKREVRGITGNYDVIAVSANSNPCISHDDQTDYRICGNGETSTTNMMVTPYTFTAQQYAMPQSNSRFS